MGGMGRKCAQHGTWELNTSSWKQLWFSCWLLKGAPQVKENRKTHQNPPKYPNNRKNPKPAAWVGTGAEAGPPLSPQKGELQAV